MTKKEINSALREDVPEKLSYAVLSAALYSGDGPWAEEICYGLIGHPSPRVRANACTALGHIARIHESMDWDRAIGVLEAALVDNDEFVRGHADSGMDDLEHFRRLKGVP